MSAAKSLKKKVAEMEKLQQQLEAMQAEVEDSRAAMGEEVQSRFDKDLVSELLALEVGRVVIDLAEDGVTVTLGAAKVKRGTGGHGEKAELYWTEYQAGARISEIARKYGVHSSTVSAALKPYRNGTK